MPSSVVALICGGARLHHEAGQPEPLDEIDDGTDLTSG
jgi:hypothetical protein